MFKSLKGNYDQRVKAFKESAQMFKKGDILQFYHNQGNFFKITAIKRKRYNWDIFGLERESIYIYLENDPTPNDLSLFATLVTLERDGKIIYNTNEVEVEI